MIELNRRARIHEFFFTIFMIFWIFEDSDGSAGTCMDGDPKSRIY